MLNNPTEGVARHVHLLLSRYPKNSNVILGNFVLENPFINNYMNLLKQYVKTSQFMGWDPYDILNCKFISDQNFGSKINLLFTQINRILPINFRNIIGISKIYNSKAMALFLSSLLNLEGSLFSKEKNFLVNWLVSNKSKKYEEYSIGFSYDIVLQGYSSERGDPSLIITLFVMYAFIKYYKETYRKDIVNYIFSFNELINRKLPKVENKNTLWYSYNFDKFSEVYNATAKVGRYFALLYSISREEILLERIDKILNYLSLKQRADGSWPYGEKSSYTDGFHTAFVLEAIYDMLNYVSSKKYEQMYENGLSHYMDHLF